MPRFNCRGYITKIFHEKKIKLQIEEEDLEKIENIFSRLYKIKKNYTSLNITFQNNTILDIKNLNYADLNDLIGVYVYVDCITKYYSFSNQEEGEDKKIYKGYNIIATNIKNYTT